jgi:hypothetical protein
MIDRAQRAAKRVGICSPGLSRPLGNRAWCRCRQMHVANVERVGVIQATACNAPRGPPNACLVP